MCTVYILGQRRFPRALLLESGILKLVDERIHSMFPNLSPGVIIALLSSFRRICLDKSMIPQTANDLITQVASLSCTLDIRTFLLSLRALSDLGFQWQSIENDQRLGITAGIARSATTSPSKLALILSAVHAFNASWADLHERIPIVLRHVLFKLFSSFKPSSSPVSEEERSASVEYISNLLRIMVDMKASWEWIGDKAAITILQALSVLHLSYAEQSAILPSLSLLFADIPKHVFEAVPSEFHFLFHLDKDSRLLTVNDDVHK